MIYFAQAVDGGPVKIGFSNNVEARLQQLEVHYGTPLALLATIPGNREREKEIHEQFSHLRFGRTEQFRPDSELMNFIGRPLLVCADPDAVEALPVAGKPLAIQVLASPEWKAWAESLANFDGMSLALLVDRALRQYAKQIGFQVKAPRR